MLISWRNGVSNSGRTGVWQMDGRRDWGLCKAECSASRDREIRPTPDYTWWFRHEKFVGTSWGKIGSYWGSAWFAVNYLLIADVAKSDAGNSDARCLLLSVIEYCFGAGWWWWRCQKTQPLNFRSDMMIMELSPLPWSKRLSQRKISDIWFLTFARFEILSYLILLQKGLIQYRTKAGPSRTTVDISIICVNNFASDRL